MREQVNYMQRVGHSKCIRCDFETSDDMTFEQQDAAMMAHLADKHPDWMGIGRAEPSPEPEAAPDENQTAWASIEASRKIARGYAELKQELTRVAEDQNLRPHFFNRIGESNMCADCDFRWTDPIHLVGEPRMYQPPASETPPLQPPGPPSAPRICKKCGGTLYDPVFGGSCKCPHPQAASEGQATAVPHMTNEMREVIIDNMTNRYICSQGEARSMARELAQLRARVAILDAQEVELPELPRPKEFSDYKCGFLYCSASGTNRYAVIMERQLLDALRAVQAQRTIMRDLRNGLVAARDFIDSGNSGWFPQQWRDAIAAYDALAGKGE